MFLRKSKIVQFQWVKERMSDLSVLQRLHSSLYYLTPEDFLNGRIDERLKLLGEKLYQARLNRIEAKNAA
jgi:hypothetical protein